MKPFNFSLKIDKKKYPGFYYGFFVTLVYNIAGYIMGIALRFEMFPKGLHEYGNIIIFPFVPVASQIADFHYEKTSDTAVLIVSLIATFLVIWVIFSPLTSLFRAMMGRQK